MNTCLSCGEKWIPETDKSGWVDTSNICMDCLETALEESL